MSRSRALVLFAAGVSLAFAFACSSNDEVTPAPALPVADAGADTAITVDAAPDAGAFVGCVDGKPVAAYPPGDYSISLLGTPPDLTFDTDGANGKVALHDYYEPCAPRSRLLVVRVSAAWCGTCAWTAAHTKDILSAFDADTQSRIPLLDLVVANEDNVPAGVSDIGPWRDKIDAPQTIAIDPTYQLNAVNLVRLPLPLLVFIDTKTMRILNALNDPPSEFIVGQIQEQLAKLDGKPAPAIAEVPREDGLFYKNQWEMIQQMALGDLVPPPDPTNAKSDDAAAAALGEQLFSEKAFSPTGTVSCATCHDAAKDFTDLLPQSLGVASGDRNAPSVLLSAHARWQFWDGRADSLWMQAIGPFENPLEFNSSRLFVVHAVYDRYKSAYENVFGALPAMNDSVRFPANGKPGDSAWNAMTSQDREAVTRAYVNVGKSIAAFERTLRIKPNALDAYIGGDKSALNDSQKHGLFEFFSAGCAQCHYGPRLTDDAFHAIRFPTGRRDHAADRGRIDGIQELLSSEFRADGTFSDSPASAHGLTGLTAGPWTLGAFKTPTLRGIAATSPFGHGGSLATLNDVVKNYGTAGLDDTRTEAVGASEPWLPKFTDSHREGLVDFLEVLTAERR